MNQNTYQNYQYQPTVAELASVDERSAFIRRTYLHLLGAIIAFGSICALLIGVFGPMLEPVVRSLAGGYTWLIVLAGFMFVSYIAERWANSDTSQAMQYMGLGLYVVAQSILFVPLLFIATYYMPQGSQVILSAGLLSAVVLGGLTLTVLITKADFSFLRSALVVGGFVAMGLIACGLLIGFPLGMWFSVAMIVFASGSILYNTSNILHHYNTEQHVAASLSLFASVTLLFWYILQMFMAMED